jgi:ABC-type multidrug transport system ATPase subunit
MLTIEDLSVRHSQHREGRLRRFHLHVGVGECCALVGPSGAGKTAVLEAIMGLRPVETGTIRVGASAVTEAIHDRRGNITVIWGSGSVDEALSVRQNLSLILQLAGARVPPRGDMDRVLRRVDLPDRLFDRAASQLSAAQRCFLWLAAACLRQTPLLLVDDPTQTWASSDVRDLTDMLREFSQSGLTIVLATRDTDLACALADRVCVMEEGQKLTEGAPSVVFGPSAPHAMRPSSGHPL